jgi:short-subunit dehydrogenase
LFVLAFNLELFTIGYIVREKEGIRTPSTVISAYVGTKFALEGLFKSIQYELEPFGIKIILIEPGAVSSNFWKNMKTANTAKPSESADSLYSQMKIKISESLKRTVQNAMHPSEVAKAILEAITSDNPEFRHYEY